MTKNSPSKLPSPAEMVAHLDLYVQGQARAKWDLARAVYNHYISQAHREREGEDLGKYHILMLGPTGVGKTYMVRLLAKFLAVPVGFSSATSLVEAGYKGDSVETMVKVLLDRAGGDPRQAERGMVFIDEIDKIRGTASFGTRDVGGEGVQNALLTLLDGRESKGQEGSGHPTVDTGRLLFVCTGAFVGLDQVIQERLGKQTDTIGFRLGSDEPGGDETQPSQPIYEALRQAETSDLVDFGMIPEFIGRLATITVMHELTHGHLREIMGDNIENSALKNKKRLARIHGIELEFTDGALDAIAEKALALETGARGLQRLVGRAVDAVDGRWPELANAGYTRVVIDRACVEDSGEPSLERGDSVQGRIDGELRELCLKGRPPRISRIADQEFAVCAAGITDTRGWSNESLREAIDRTKVERLDWNNTTGSARKWWVAFETENRHRMALVYRLVEELRNRKATITEFFLAHVYSNVDNLQANLLYFDYSRLKREEEKKKKAARMLVNSDTDDTDDGGDGDDEGDDEDDDEEAEAEAEAEAEDRDIDPCQGDADGSSTKDLPCDDDPGSPSESPADFPF